MHALDDYIFGNSRLHAQLAIATKILALLAANAPQCVTLEAMQSATRRSAMELRKICKGFNRAGFVTTPEQPHDAWMLHCDLGTVTLEDVYLAITAGSGSSKKSVTGAAEPAASPQQNNLDLILMQATMSINQSLFRLLRQFRLDRLQIATAAGASSPSQAYSRTYIRSREPALHKVSEFN